jgi:hypothetical protein
MDKLLENHQFATHAIAASASVSLGTALAYPLDTIKTIIQVFSLFFTKLFFLSLRFIWGLRIALNYRLVQDPIRN